MTRIRIRCRVPRQTPLGGCVPAWQDVQAFAVADDGTEVELHNIMSVRFEATASPEPVLAHVAFINPEIDVEAVDEVALLRENVAKLEQQLTEHERRATLGAPRRTATTPPEIEDP